MISPENVSVKMYSITGALVADYYNNVANNEGMEITLIFDKIGGLDTFEITLANNFKDPLFPDMDCQIFVDGVFWAQGFVDTVPELDSSSAEVIISGKGYFHKLSTVIVNETYTAQTLDFIIKDIASTYLTTDLHVMYDVLKVLPPVVTNVSIEFKDKTLDKVFNSLLEIANFDYNDDQYKYFIYKRYFYFTTSSLATDSVWFEGYNYHSPVVETYKDKLINKILAYRTTVADDSVVEYVATYSNADSISRNGTASTKFTFPDYVDTTSMEKMCLAYIEKYKEPITKMELQEVEVSSPVPWAKTRLINQRLEYYKSVSKLENLDGWTLTNLTNTTPSISSDEVFTDRTNLKLVTAVGSQDDYMFMSPDPIIYFPTFFKVYSYRTNAGSMFTFRLSDSFGNILDVPIGHNNEPINEWVKYNIPIALRIGHELLYADKDVSNGGLLRLDYDASNFGNNKIDFLLVEGILNLYRIDLLVDSDIAATSYFDRLDILSSSYKEHTLPLERAQYRLGKARTADLSFGDIRDSIVDEIVAKNKSGESALAVFSKQ